MSLDTDWLFYNCSDDVLFTLGDITAAIIVCCYQVSRDEYGVWYENKWVSGMTDLTE